LKRVVGILFGIVLAAVCLGVFFRGVEDPGRLWARITAASPALLGLLIVASVLHIALRSWRWRTLLGASGRGVPFSELFAAVSVGYMASLLPARIGDVLRPTMLSRRASVPLGASLSTVAAERAVLDLPFLLVMLALALVLPAGWTGLGAHSQADTLSGMRRLGLVGLIVSIAGLAVVVLLARQRAAVDAWLRHRAALRGGRIGRILSHAAASLLPGLATFESPGGVVRLAAETALIWGIVGAGIHAGIAACGIALAPLAMLMVVPVTAFSFLAMTPGGAGTYQLAMFVVLVRLLGVGDEDSARAASLVVHAVALIPVLILGGWYAVRRGTRPPGP
jgi:hypothetical protein